MNKLDGLIAVIKQQAEVFLLDTSEFFPFGTYINNKYELVSCSAYLETENDQPESLALIDILKGFFVDGVENGNVLIGAITIDVLINQNEIKFDAIQVRFFEKGDEYSQTFKYIINENSVDFIAINV